MKVYEGIQTHEDTIVTVDGRPLDPRLDLRNHSPAGFGWGYPGSGPAQLALAILADHLGGDGKSALELHQDFKFHTIAGLKEPWWQLTSADIETALDEIRSRRH